MSGQLKKRLALIASLLVVGAAIAVPIILKSSDVVLPGSAIEHPDYSAVTLAVREPLVGDVVMFELDVPDIKDGKTIRVTEIAASPDHDLTLLGARIYHRKDFGGSALLGWQSSNGDDLDPHQRPSTDLVGATLSGGRNPDNFLMFEFAICATGNYGVDEIDIQYESASHMYEQTLKVDFKVRDALPGVPCETRLSSPAS